MKRSVLAAAVLIGACSNDNAPQKAPDGGSNVPSNGGSVASGGTSSGGRIATGGSGTRGGNGGTAAQAGAAGTGGLGPETGGAGGVSGAGPNDGGTSPDASDVPDAGEPGPDADVKEGGAPSSGVHFGRWLLYLFNGISLLDVSTFPLPSPVPLPQSGGRGVWSPNGRYFAYVGTSGRGLVLDLSGPNVGTPTNVAAGGAADTLSFSWAPSSSILATNRDGSVAVLDPSDPAPIPGVVEAGIIRYGWLHDSSGLAYTVDHAGTRDVMFARIAQFKVASSKKIATFTFAYNAFAVSPVRDEFAYVDGDTLSLVRTVGGVPGTPLQVSLGAQQGVPQWLQFSSDGNWLLAHMETSASSSSDLPDDFLVDVRGATLGTPRRLRTLLGIDNLPGLPAFSPDGKWFAFTTGDSSIPTNDFSLVDLSGATPSGASIAVGSNIPDFVWSPSSTSLIVLNDYANKTALELADPRAPGTRNTLTTEPSTLTSEFGPGYSLGYSPDGRILAYTVSRALKTRTIAGTTLGDINAVDTGVTNMSWSPASDKLAYTKAPDTGTHRQLFIVRMAGASPSAPIPIEISTTDNYNAEYYWQP